MSGDANPRVRGDQLDRMEDELSSMGLELRHFYAMQAQGQVNELGKNVDRLMLAEMIAAVATFAVARGFGLQEMFDLAKARVEEDSRADTGEG